MKKLKIGYKVVSLNLNSHYSSYCAPLESTVRYRRDCFTKRPEGCGPLAVFRHKKYAKRFSSGTGARIFKCEYEPSEQVYLSNGFHIKGLNELPKDTHFAEKVRLLEEVK